MFLTKLAFKNLVRHRNRTIITSIIIALAIFIYIIYDSLIGGMTEMSYATIIDFESGHLQLVDENYWEEEEKLPLDNLFTYNDELKIMVEAVAGYLAASAELSFTAQLNNGIDELPVLGKGIDPAVFEEVFRMENNFEEGSMFLPGERKAVLGKRLAELMELGVGDFITLLVKGKHNTFNTIDVEIAGLVHTSNPSVNQNTVYLPLDLVQEALNTGDQVSKVIIRLEDKGLSAEAAEELESLLQKEYPGLAVYPWYTLEAITFLGAAELEKQVILAIILTIAAIAIINTVILAALERMTEIGMMKAQGLQNHELVYTFVMESTGIGIIGGIIGMIIGIIAVWLMSRYGVDFNALVGMDMASFGLPILGKTYGVWNP
ncbi:MAG: ABC transporter permease, partial [Halanaerobiaceae bacterium]|nr:ABC transporter permease [Halanaerobiaceae bacterium]